MIAKADRSILKGALDKTRDTEIVDEILVSRALTRKKKRVSFSESIAVKTIASRLEQQRAGAGEFSSPGDNNNNNIASTKVSNSHNSENVLPLKGATPTQSKILGLAAFCQWNLDDETRSFIARAKQEEDSDASLRSDLPLQPKMTGNRHMSFFIDPDESEREIDEQAFHRAELTLLNATVQPFSVQAQAYPHNDDFSRFLSDEGLNTPDVNEIDMDISELPEQQQQAPEVMVNADVMDLDIEKDLSLMDDLKNGEFAGRGEVSKISSIPSAARTYVVAKDDHEGEPEVTGHDPATYTIMKDQSTRSIVEEGFRLRQSDRSWDERPSEMTMSQVLDFSQQQIECSRNLSAISTTSKQLLHPPNAAVPCENFNSPLRKDRRRTFVVVHRLQDREERREKMLRERASFEPTNVAALNCSQQNASVLLEPRPSGQRQNLSLQQQPTIEVEQLSQPQPCSQSEPQKSTYKYTLPESFSHKDPHELVRFFVENSRLDVGSFAEVLESVIHEYTSSPDPLPFWEQTSDGVPSPHRLVQNPSFSWTPTVGDLTATSLVSPAWTTPVSTASVFEDKSNKLKQMMDEVSQTVDKLKLTSRLILPGGSTNSTTNKPELLSRLSPDVHYRLVPETGVSIWQFPCQPGTVKVEVHITSASEMSQSIDATVYLKKSQFGGPWLSKFGDLATAMIACRLGIPNGNINLSKRFASEADLEPFLVSVGTSVRSARALVCELITVTSKQLLYDPEQNFQVTYENDDPLQPHHLVIELSAFPILAILPGPVDICAKATLIIDVDLANYPNDGSLVVADATISGGVGVSMQIEEIIEQFDSKVKNLRADPSPQLTLNKLGDLLVSLKQVS